MKKLLPVILLCCSYLCHGQNYQCLQSGVKHYFTNSNGYLRGIRIDSVRTIGDTVVYYPFHTPRGAWSVGLGGIFTSIDSTGGSWLGKKVLQLSDGTFIFDNIWHDSVKIKTQANLSDSWIFYNDTSNIYYKASVISIDTMSLWGILDTVKTILINAYNGTTLITTDPINGFQILLSKNHGFVQVCDLYMFPYHAAGSNYINGLDYYLDMSLSPVSDYYLGGSPDAVNSIYKLVTFINPTSNQLYASNIGDVYETGYYTASSTPIPNSYILDTIITKTVLPHSITYTSSGLSGHPLYGPGSPFIVSYYHDGYSTDDSTYLFDTSKMPEEVYPNDHAYWCNYYFPNDSSFCTASPLYVSGWVYGGFCGDGVVNAYKIGFGNTHFLQETDDPYYWENKLRYAKKDNNPCGSFNPLVLPSSVQNIIKDNALTIFPNPVTTTLTIRSTNNINDITITNILGQVVYSKHGSTSLTMAIVGSSQVEVNVVGLPSGVYFVKVNGDPSTSLRMTGKFVKE